MKRLIIAALALCMIATDASSFWQSRDSNYNVSIVASGGPTCTLATIPLVTTSSTSAQTQSVNIGSAAADRLVIVGAGTQNATATLSSVTANGVALTQDATQTSAGETYIYSGLVTTGSGAQNIVVNWVGGAFLTRFLWVATCNGLSSNLKRQSVAFTSASGAGSGTISVVAGDFMFFSQYINAATGAPNLNASTVAPTHVNFVSASSLEADWTISTTNASFIITNTGLTNSGPAVAVTYR